MKVRRLQHLKRDIQVTEALTEEALPGDEWAKMELFCRPWVIADAEPGPQRRTSR